MSLGANKQALMGAAGSGGAADNFYDYQIAKSVRIPAPSSTSSNNGRLTRTFSTVDSSVHWTLNFWIKRSAIEGNNPVSSARALNMFTPRSGTSGSVLQEFVFSSSGSLGAGDALMITNTNSGNIVLSTDNLFRDTSAWYNIHIQADLDNGTNGERLKFFINGTEASYNTDNRGSYTSLPGITAGAWTIGDYYGYGYPIQSYLAQWAYVDGSTLAPTVFSEEKNGVWIPKDLSSGITWGSAGHLLDFADSSALGNDVSGNNNDWTTSNIDTHDQMLDSPTFGSSSTGNCCTLNPLTEQSGLTITENNLKMSRSSAGNVAIPATMGASTGKYYFEVYWNNDTTVGNYAWGFVEPESTLFGNDTAIQIPDTYNLRVNSGNAYINGAGVITMNSTTPTTGTIIGIAIDFDNGKIFYGQDGGSSSRAMNWNNSNTGTGVPQSGTNPAQTFTAGSITLIPAFSISSIGDTNWILNFGQSSAFSGALTSQGNADGNGQGDFYYSPPSGFTCWSAGGLSMDANVDPAQTDDNYPQKQFNMLQYTGNGSERTLTTQFQIDMGWNRSTIQAQNWYALDTSRGWFGASSNNKYLSMNLVDQEATFPQYNFKAQSGNDVTITGGSWLNSTGHTQQMWYWKGNGGTTTTPSGGTLATTVQANTDAGFSIVQYTGDGGTSNFTLAHGLGKKPNMVLLKDRSNNGNNQQWHVFMIDAGSIPNENYFYTSYASTGGTSTNGTINSSTTTTTVLGMSRTSAIGGGMSISQSGHNFLMYVFANIEGYSKYDMYVGNNSNDGTFVYTGFKPAFILIKDFDSANSWRTFDAINDPFNPAYHWMVLDGSITAINTSDRTTDVDFLSNGFKIRGDSNSINGTDGNKYVYMAWGSNPFKYAVAR